MNKSILIIILLAFLTSSLSMFLQKPSKEDNRRKLQSTLNDFKKATTKEYENEIKKIENDNKGLYLQIINGDNEDEKEIIKILEYIIIQHSNEILDNENPPKIDDAYIQNLLWELKEVSNETGQEFIKIIYLFLEELKVLAKEYHFKY